MTNVLTFVVLGLLVLAAVSATALYLRTLIELEDWRRREFIGRRHLAAERDAHARELARLRALLASEPLTAREPTNVDKVLAYYSTER